jgi:hypothetical protein
MMASMLRVIVFFILSKSALNNTASDMICNAVARALRAEWPDRISGNLRLGSAGLAVC